MIQPAGSENNTVTINGSTLSNSPVTSGSHARVSVTVGSAEEQSVARAVQELREALSKAQSALDRRDDETRESLELAASRLTALEEEMHTEKTKPDWARVKKLMGGIRDALTGLTSLTASADSLWVAVEKMVH